jgi:hypothetical protein
VGAAPFLAWSNDSGATFPHQVVVARVDGGSDSSKALIVRIDAAPRDYREVERS